MKKHTFAIFFAPLDQLLQDNLLRITDQEIYHRVTRILRFAKDDNFVLFNYKLRATVSLIAASNNALTLTVGQVEEQTALHPTITVALPLLKREDLESAIVGLTEIGVNNIQLIYTQNSRKELKTSEYERLQRLIISGAEQSQGRNIPPLLHKPIPLANVFAIFPGLALLFHQTGQPIVPLISTLQQQSSLLLLVGPEADFTDQELTLLQPKVTTITLGPTVLRATTAIQIGAGLLRALR